MLGSLGARFTHLPPGLANGMQGARGSGHQVEQGLLDSLQGEGTMLSISRRSKMGKGLFHLNATPLVGMWVDDSALL